MCLSYISCTFFYPLQLTSCKLFLPLTAFWGEVGRNSKWIYWCGTRFEKQASIVKLLLFFLGYLRSILNFSRNRCFTTAICSLLSVFSSQMPLSYLIILATFTGRKTSFLSFSKYLKSIKTQLTTLANVKAFKGTSGLAWYLHLHM